MHRSRVFSNPVTYTIIKIFSYHYIFYLIHCYYLGVFPPTNIRATVLSSGSIQIIWESSPTDDVNGYLISYTTTVPFTSRESMMVNGGSTISHTLTDLEEDTLYTITVQATTSDNRMSANSNEVSVRTYTDGK